MVLATVEAGRPVTRSVLCKSVRADGVTFYTNYESAKGLELAAAPAEQRLGAVISMVTRSV